MWSKLDFIPYTIKTKTLYTLDLVFLLFMRLRQQKIVVVRFQGNPLTLSFVSIVFVSRWDSEQEPVAKPRRQALENRTSTRSQQRTITFQVEMLL